MMKKIISTTLLLAAGTAFANAVVFVSSSAVTQKNTGSETYTGPTYSGELSQVDLWSTANGTSDKSSITGKWILSDGESLLIPEAKQEESSALNSKSFRLNDLYNAVSLDDSVELVSYSFLSRYDGMVTNGLYAQILDSSGSVLGTSAVVSYDTNATTRNKYGAGTFTFDSGIILSASETYTFKLVTKSGETYVDNTENVSMGTLNPYYSTSKYGGYVIDGNYSCQPIIAITTQSVPEPSAFGLLAGLGALALVASRRRRSRK